MQEQLTHTAPFRLSFYDDGGKKPVLLAFTGFGESAKELMAQLKEAGLNSKYRIICFNYFFHGKYVYPTARIKKDPITKKEFKTLFQQFFRNQKIEHADVFGYSLGGKLALLLKELLPEKIDRVFIAAPDGLKKIWWYNWVSGFPPFLAIYRYYIKKPYWYFWWMKLIGRLRFLPKKTVHFAIEQMKTEEQRRQIHNVWLSLKNLEPNPKKIGEAVKEQGLLKVFLGRYDKVIRLRNGRIFCKNSGLDFKDTVVTMNYGHKLLRPEPLEEIAKEIINIASR
ncbi:MAG: hypothetical protein ACPF8V_02725 [Luteibaculum sp.]